MQKALRSLFSLICIIFYSNTIQAQYCTPSVSNKSFAYITAVSFSTINNNSQSPAFSATTGIQDYTTMSALLVQGISSTLSVTINLYSTYDHRIYAYIDWDQDQDFEDEVGQPYIINPTATTVGPHNLAILPPVGALLGTTRMRLVVDANENPASCGRASDGNAIWLGEYEDYLVELLPPGPYTYTSSTTSQEDTSFANYCQNDQQIIGVEIEVGGAGTVGSLDLTELELNMNGCTRWADASNISIYYTGTSHNFAATNLFATVTPGVGTQTAVGTQSLSFGTNYFWIAYDMITAYTSADTMDAECTQITVGGINYPLTISAPAGGKRTVSCPFTGDCAIPYTPSYCFNEIGGSIQWIENVTVGTINNNSVHDVYGDYTAQVVNMTAGVSYPISVRSNFTWASSGVGIYVDWNLDGDFKDAFEVVYEDVTIVPPANVWSTNITPPLTAVNGLIRMRIVESYTNNLPLAACGGSLTYDGDVEDYSINLTGGVTPPAVPAIPNGVAKPFTNGDFATGDLEGWTASSGFHPLGGNYSAVYSGGCCPDPTVQVAFMRAADPDDPCDGFPVVPPATTTSLRLGNISVGAEADRVAQTFMVDTANSTLTYHYAIVMNEPGHSAPQQPLFNVTLRDANGCAILCADYSATSGFDNRDFIVSACGGEYLDWHSRSVDLFRYIGKDVTIEFTMFDCAQGAHFGYAYIAVTTAPTIVPLDSICIAPGDPVTLTAPVGYNSYLWSTTESTPTINDNPLVATNYNVVATNTEGCANQIDYRVSTDCFIFLNSNLLSFDAKATDDFHVLLDWQIASSNDIDYFILEKSIDGVVFKPFATQGSNGDTFFETKDEDPFAGTSYYRLKMMQSDGFAAFSEVRAVDIDLNGGINIFPNPASNYFTIRGTYLEDASVVIHDALGQKILALPPVKGQTATYYAGTLPNGIYLISVFVDGVKVKTQKLVVRH